MTRVFIDGAAGTTGLEIRERLAGRPEIAPIVLDEARRADYLKAFWSVVNWNKVNELFAAAKR